jgi:DNA polymerase-3 subunit epsilon
LNIIADHLSLRFNHHNAAEDAVVCGMAAIAIAKKLKVAHIADIPPKIGMREGKLMKRGYEPCSIARR